MGADVIVGWDFKRDSDEKLVKFWNFWVELQQKMSIRLKHICNKLLLNEGFNSVFIEELFIFIFYTWQHAVDLEDKNFKTF